MTKTEIDKLLDASKKADERKKKRDEYYKQCFNKVSQSIEGKYVLQLIKNLSLWDRETTNATQDSLAYERGRRDMWLLIRQFVPKDTLAQIEIYGMQEDITE